MNNIDINKAVAIARGMSIDVVDNELWAGRKYESENVVPVFGIYDPVNRLDQALGLITEERINIDWIQGIVYKDGKTEDFTDETDLPAAICSVYLQVK